MSFRATTWGFAPSSGLRAAYRQFLEKPGELRIELRPSDGFDPRTLALYKPQDALALLNPSLQVNGTPVTDLSFRTDIVPAKPAAPAASAGAPPSSVASGRAPAAAPAEQSGYRSVPPASLAQYIGRDVRVHTAGKTRDGILAEVQGGSITLERTYARGAATFKLAVKQIQRVEVLF